ncbi:MAG: ion transporter [Planctomycetota bacterium]|nr:ion transporter [Planctomycetota bacterium]
MNFLKRIIESPNHPHGKIFTLVVQGLIIISLITFSIETLPGLSPRTRDWLNYVEYFIVAFFSVEYLLRVFVASPRHKYIFSFFGLVDLAAILPFYLGTAIDLRTLRTFRLLRLFRIFKLTRYSIAVRRFHRAMIIAREAVVLFLCAAGIVLYLAAVGIYYFENETQPKVFASVFHSLWWAVSTLTTVGYGDVYPVTLGGKIFTFFVLLIGLGIVSVPAGLVASALSKAREMEENTQLTQDTSPS